MRAPNSRSLVPTAHLSNILVTKLKNNRIPDCHPWAVSPIGRVVDVTPSTALKMIVSDILA